MVARPSPASLVTLAFSFLAPSLALHESITAYASACKHPLKELVERRLVDDAILMGLLPRSSFEVVLLFSAGILFVA